jgi:hypothetical protein
MGVKKHKNKKHTKQTHENINGINIKQKIRPRTQV